MLSYLGTATVSAGNVSINEALQKAKTFMPSRQFKEGVRSARSKSSVNSNQPYYIFNDQQGHGFVIVSGTDCTTPVLGYADNGTIDIENMPENLSSWLEDYAEQISVMKKTAAKKPAEKPMKPAIAPLIHTTWNQNMPYSLMTPTYTNDKGETIHYTTGCVATAIAQVMCYYQWPENCQAIPAYTTSTQQIFMSELPATTFKWGIMQENYLVNTTGEAADAVAEVMLYAGQAMKMNYDKSGSKAMVDLTSMADCFGYSKNAYKAYRDDYSNTLWENLIYNELASNRPVLYSGQSESGAHQFVCDGYDGNGLFHINWGWGGSCNGYFLLSLANPDEKEEGPGFCGYAAGQSAIIGLQPKSDNESETPHFNTSVVAFEEKSYSRSSFNDNFTDVSTEGCYINGSFNYDPTTAYTMELGWGLYEGGEIKKVFNSTAVRVDTKSACYYAPKTINFGAGMADGTYRLVMAYRPEGATTWTTATDQQCLYTEIDDNKLSIRGARNTMSYHVNQIDFIGEMTQHTKVDVAVNITNNSDKMRQDAYLWMRQGNDAWKEVSKGIGYYEPGQTGDICLAFTAEMPGTYQVKITTDSNGSNVMATSEFTIYEVKKTLCNDVQYACNMGTKEAKVINYVSLILENVDIPATVTVDGTEYTVTRIDENAFKNAFFLKEVKLPSSLKEIGDYAFASCNELTYIQSAMTEPCIIGKNAFTTDDNSVEEALKSVTLCVPVGSKSCYKSADVWEEFQHIYQGELKETTQNGMTYTYATGEDFAEITATDKAVLKNTDVVIPSSIEVDEKTYHVKAIAKNAFHQLPMKSLTIESGIEEIGDGAFRNVIGLQTVTLPEGLKKIGENAFIYCYGLEEVHLPSTLHEIGNYAFADCTKLTSVVSAMTNPCTISSVFVNNRWNGDVQVEEHSSAVLYVPKNSKSNYTSDEKWKEFPNIVEVEMETSGIHDIKTTNHISEQIFSITGRRLLQPQKGINIINGRKVLMR